jgi:hypothetical protein
MGTVPQFVMNYVTLKARRDAGDRQGAKFGDRLQVRHEPLDEKQNDEVGGSGEDEERNIASGELQHETGERGDEHSSNRAAEPGDADHRSNGAFRVRREYGHANVGKELYFVSADQKMMVAAIKPSGKFGNSSPKPRFDVHIAPFASFDVASDGRFLIPVPVERGVPATLNVIINWAASLKR